MYAQIWKQVTDYAKKISKPLPRLVSVSKTKPVKLLLAAYAEGAREFGENYVQEALGKLHTCPGDCVWHMIGPLQSNKTRLVAEHFDWVQSVDRTRLATRLSDQRPRQMGQLACCIQVNIDGQPTKSGCAPHQALELARLVASQPGLQLRGMMVIPNPHQSARGFASAAKLFDQLRDALPGEQLDTLSMGMSGDWQQALQAGSSLIRIGTAIFGERDYSTSQAQH